MKNVCSPWFSDSLKCDNNWMELENSHNKITERYFKYFQNPIFSCNAQNDLDTYPVFLSDEANLKLKHQLIHKCMRWSIKIFEHQQNIENWLNHYIRNLISMEKKFFSASWGAHKIFMYIGFGLGPSIGSRVKKTQNKLHP